MRVLLKTFFRRQTRTAIFHLALVSHHTSIARWNSSCSLNKASASTSELPRSVEALSMASPLRTQPITWRIHHPLSYINTTIRQTDSHERRIDIFSNSTNTAETLYCRRICTRLASTVGKIFINTNEKAKIVNLKQCKLLWLPRAVLVVMYEYIAAICACCAWQRSFTLGIRKWNIVVIFNS